MLFMKQPQALSSEARKPASLLNADITRALYFLWTSNTVSIYILGSFNAAFPHFSIAARLIMHVCLQEFFQFSQAILNSRYKIIYETQIFIFVSIQQVQELCGRSPGVSWWHLLALHGKLVFCALKKVHLDPPLLLQQTGLCLFHMFSNRVLLQEFSTLSGKNYFCVSQKLRCKDSLYTVSIGPFTNASSSFSPSST